MDKKVLKIIGIAVGSILLTVYVLFLIVPFFLTGLLNSYSSEISKMVEDASGFKIKLEQMQIITTPKLTAGLKVGHADFMYPTGESFLKADNFKVKLSLLPILARRIEIDSVSVDKIYADFKVQSDGKFLIEKYIPQQDTNSENSDTQTPVVLPLGLKLSNHLPDITVKDYNLSFIDIPTDKVYSLNGDKIKIADFVLNKKIKISASGRAVLDNRTQFNYDVKLFNKIMPDVQLNDLVFNPQTDDDVKKPESVKFNVIDIFKAVYNNQVTADVNAKVMTSGDLNNIEFKGFLNVDKLAIAVDGNKLPDSNVHIKFNGNKILMDTKLYSAKDELTQLTGDFKTGKKAHIDLTCKSNAKFASLFDMADSLAKSFGYKELGTLTASGGIDADFNVKSNLKKNESSGYLKIVSGNILYKLYNVAINNINADIDFADNMVNVKNAGLSIAGQPLSIKGTVSDSASADLHVLANNLQIKGLIAAAGQMALLKDNDFRSGVVSLDASLKGKLKEPKPEVNLSVDNVNLKNIPSDTNITLAGTKINITSDGKTFKGLVDVSHFGAVNPMAAVSVPQAGITFGEKDIVIDKAYMLLNNSRIDLTGKIADYMTKKINFDIKASGAILASDIKSMIPADMRKDIKAVGSLPVAVTVTGNDKAQEINFKLTANHSNYVNITDVDSLKGQSLIINSNMKISGDKLKLSDTGAYTNSISNPLVTVSGSVNNIYAVPKLALNISTPNQLGISVPGFKNSKVSAKGDINVSGSINNPHLNGSVSVPQVSLPDMDLIINGLNINLNGPIIKGNGTVKSFKSGGIAASNVTSDFGLNGNNFYLTNIAGDAFSGKINGSVTYNIANGKIGIDFKGSGMNAESAIEGAAGINNALSGKLGFSAKVNLSGATDIEMMKSLKGNVTFKIEDGSFGNIGRFENLLFADNIMANAIMKAAVLPIVNLPAIKDTAAFKYIQGEMTFANGWANLISIKTAGPSMAYYITGKYNLLNGTANLIILGRLSAQVVSLLGPVGDLSVDKLTSYIPKFGALTGKIIKAMTTNPKGENVAAIPQLSSGNKNYKDFKVVFNGGIESKTSVKSFKWLSECDTTEVENESLKEQLRTTTQALKEAREQKLNETIDKIDAIKTDTKNSLEEARKRAEESRQKMIDAKNNLNNLKNLLKN